MQKLHYLFVMWDGGGTLPPELALAQQLIERGQKVSVLGEDSMQVEIEAAQCSFFGYQYAPNRPNRLPESDPFPDWGGQSPLKVIKKLLIDSASDYAKDVIHLCQNREIDRIVVDGFLMGGLIGAATTRKPYFALWPALDLIPHPGRLPDGLGLMPGKTIFGKVRNRMLNGLFRKMLQSGRKEINKILANYQLSLIKHPFDLYHLADRVLLLSSRHFDFPTQLPANVRYIGPRIADPHWAANENIQFPPSGHPRILVSFGSTFQAQKALYQKVITTLSQLPVEAIITLGNVFTPREFDTHPNIKVLASASHKHLLPQCDLVINHGGHGTVIKTILAGLPQLVIPLGRDQFGNASRVVYHGLGLKAKKNDSINTLNHKINQLLTEKSFRENAKIMADKIREEMAEDHLRFLLQGAMS